MIPVIVFTTTGITNDLGRNTHLYAFQISLILAVYALMEETLWRGYFINVFTPLGKFKAALLLGILWWAWHFPFMRPDGYTTFLLVILISSFLIGKFVEGTRSYLTAAGLHSLIVIVQVGNNERPMLYAAGIVIIIWLLIDKLWKNKSVMGRHQAV